MKKSLLLVLLIAVMACCLVACGGGGDTTENSSAPDWTSYDELIAQIKAETDFATREALMHQAEDMLMATGAVMPLYYYNDVYMMKDGIEGFYMTPYQTKYFMYTTYGDKTSLNINLASEPQYLDPALNSSVDGACLAANSFAGLYTYNANNEQVPALAESYEVSEDGLTYTFTLKEGLKFSDGSDLTVDDVVYSWKRAADPETAADYSYMFNGIAGYGTEEGIQVANVDGKFQVVLSAPCAYFLDLCAFPTFYVVSQDCVEAAAGYTDADGNILNPGAWATEAGFVTSGAYTLESWTHDESMTYVKNPNFYDAANVTMDKLHFMLSADDAAIYAAYKSGDLDFIDNVPADETANAKQSPEYHIDAVYGTYYVAFNVNADLFAGMTVEQAAAMRQAISYLIDRQYIVDTVTQTGNTIATTYIPEAMSDGHGGEFKANDDAYTYPVDEGYYDPAVNVDKARELLTEAGFQFDENGMLSAETPISFEYLTNQNTAHEAIAQCIQQDLAVVGINMTIKTLDWNVFLAERKAGNFGIAREGWIADFNDPINMLEMFITESGNNDCQFGR